MAAPSNADFKSRELLFPQVIICASYRQSNATVPAYPLYNLSDSKYNIFLRKISNFGSVEAFLADEDPSTAVAIEQSAKLIGVLASLSIIPETVNPSYEGGVILTFSKGPSNYVIEVFEDGDIALVETRKGVKTAMDITLTDFSGYFKSEAIELEVANV